MVTPPNGSIKCVPASAAIRNNALTHDIAYCGGVRPDGHGQCPNHCTEPRGPTAAHTCGLHDAQTSYTCSGSVVDHSLVSCLRRAGRQVKSGRVWLDSSADTERLTARQDRSQCIGLCRLREFSAAECGQVSGSLPNDRCWHCHGRHLWRVASFHRKPYVRDFACNRTS